MPLRPSCAVPLLVVLREVAADFPAEGIYNFRNVNSGKYLNVAEDAMDVGGNVWQWDNPDMPASQWRLTAIASGTYTVTSVNSGKVLSVQDSSLDNGGNVWQWDNPENPSSQWRIACTTMTSCTVQNVNSGKFLNVQDNSLENGGNVWQWDNPENPSSQWSLAAPPVPPKGKISMDSPAILYSPFNWGVSARAAKSINAGAYFKVVVSGKSVRLATDTSAIQAPYSQFLVRVDGGPWVQHSLAPGNPTYAVDLGPSTASKHLLEVVLKSSSEGIDRWSPQSSAVVFTGLLLDEHATVTAPIRKPRNILVFGDSITEGIRANGGGMAQDTDQNDATKDYAWQLSQELPAEVGVVAFGWNAFSHGGSGGVPPLGDTWQWLWEGQARSFSEPAPDLVVYNEGTNDHHVDISEAFRKVVRGIQQVAPNAVQLLLVPFNQDHAGEIRSVVASFDSSKVRLGETSGWFDPADGSDGLHPYGYAHLAFIAPRMAKLCSEALNSAETILL